MQRFQKIIFKEKKRKKKKKSNKKNKNKIGRKKEEMDYHQKKDLEILFWAKKMKQHFHFTSIFIVDNLEKLEKYLTSAKIRITVDQLMKDTLHFERVWGRIYNSLDPMEEIEERLPLLIKTYRFNLGMATLFKKAGIPCAPALFEHMSGEVVYLLESIINESWSYETEMAWWAQEHAENLNFINCELPRLLEFKKLLNADGLKKFPEMAKMFIENKKLANKFMEIKKSIEKREEGGQQNITSEIYHEMMRAKIVHLNGIKSLMKKLKTLPLSEKNRSIVYQILNHEHSEAVFAFARLRQPMTFI
jgi:hypothetical protein